MELIDGKKIADAIKQEIADEVAKMVAAGGKKPTCGKRRKAYNGR